MRIVIEAPHGGWPRSGNHPSGFDDIRETAMALGLGGTVLRPGSTCLVALRGGVPTPAHWGLERNADACVQSEHLPTVPRMQRLLGIARCVVPATIMLAQERDERGREARTFGIRSRRCDTMYCGAILKTMNGRNGPVRRFILITRPTQICPQAAYRMPLVVPPDLVESWLSPSTAQSEVLRIATLGSDADVQARPILIPPGQGTTRGPWSSTVLGHAGWDHPQPDGPEEVVI